MRHVEETAQLIADKKERGQWMLFEIQKRNAQVRQMRDRLRALQVAVLGVKDKEERVSMMAENLKLQKEVEDRLFALAVIRSDARRIMKEVASFEAKIITIRAILQRKG